MSFAPIPANQVLVTVGTGAIASAIGTTEAHRAANINDPNLLGFAAADARLVSIDPDSPLHSPVFLHREGDQTGQPISVSEITERWGSRLLEDMGTRRLPATMMAAHVPVTIGGPLPHDLERGGLRELMGMSFKDLRASPLVNMALLFEDDPRLGPSLQSQLFLYGGLQALAALPRPLAEILPDAYRFRIAASTCFQGHDSWEALSQGMQGKDKVAYRLASVLNTHGPALLSSMLAPDFHISKTAKRLEKEPDYLERNLVRDPSRSRMKNVPQAPLVSSAACASAFLNFCDIAPHIQLSSTRRYGAPAMVLWTSADAALGPDARILEGFGPEVLMTEEKLKAGLGGRGRPLSRALAPFDIDANGTIVGNGGFGLIITTLEFAMANFLDITSIIPGWGQSSEAGGKGQFAGVGFGGENATFMSLMMAFEDHGFGVNDFEHEDDHGTGTRRNSKSSLKTLSDARRAAAAEQGFLGRLVRMTVGAPKSAQPGTGHPMGPAGALSAKEALHYVMGQPTVGIPTMDNPDPELGEELENYDLRKDPISGNEDGGAIASVQGFGGYNGAMVFRSANRDTISRYRLDDERIRDAYFERWSQIRREREANEARAHRTIGSTLRLAAEHRWPGAK